MTPFARQLHRIFQDNDGKISPSTKQPHELKDLIKTFEAAICFDVSPVEELIKETAKQIHLEQIKSHALLSNNSFGICHGGLIYPVTGNEPMWLEMKFNGHIGFMAEMSDTAEKRFDISYFECNKAGKYDAQTVFVEYDDEVAWGGFYRQTMPHNQEDGRDIIKLFILIMLVLNAPYGIKREAQPIHKGHAREARKRGYTLKPHNIVTLDRSAPPREYNSTGKTGANAGIPKAFHFVRGHRRVYTKGREQQLNSIVKAHWRGDPRLGIHQHDYRVK